VDTGRPNQLKCIFKFWDRFWLQLEIIRLDSSIARKRYNLVDWWIGVTHH